MSTNMYLKSILDRHLAESQAKNAAGWEKYHEDQRKNFEKSMEKEQIREEEEEPNMWKSFQPEREFSRIWEWRAPSLRLLFGVDKDPRADISELEKEINPPQSPVTTSSDSESDSETSSSDSGISSHSSASSSIPRRTHLKPVRVKIDTTEEIEKRKEIVNEWMAKIKESMA